MKVGYYVRTKEGFIARVTEIYERNIECDSPIKTLYEEKYNTLWENEIENIIKSSPNIIDLIEVGDYVNGKLVEKIFDKTNYADKSIKLKGSGDYWYNEHIKSIVTKKQFERMEYRIGKD